MPNPWVRPPDVAIGGEVKEPERGEEGSSWGQQKRQPRMQGWSPTVWGDAILCEAVY